ncbi:UDP-N-acetylglucosamine 2-epimerase [Marinomonas sp. S3726]|uniref:UDP-N-acetylglucosamine 2-epimerase n=1 Tax=Marinomonas sp. S3726 TaxID=579484 RepID=UPI0005FA8D07|nr:UDP-N-acetylglucosamine 2-epimerase [Marinomonas sp. S3726]KJZ15967.1 UDP-N-acetylglucosamine 2-epimerase [Marinomonas sp. S3726]
MINKKKTILVVTGIRSEYDILYPVLKQLQKEDEFEVKLVVTGAHLSDWHGNTWKKIKEDGFNIVDKIDYLLMTNRKTQRSKGVGLLVAALSQTVEREEPDCILFVGDREESIACCIVGNYMDVRVAHIAGGDTVYGNSDDPIRFACSELAHIHFTLAQKYADNLIALGEEPYRICFSGNPALRNLIDTPHMSKTELSTALGFDLEDYIVLLKHPLSSTKDDTYKQMVTTVESVQEFATTNGLKVVGIYPNTDPGSYDILNVIDELDDPNIKFFKTLNRELFVNVMRHSLALIGNSSMGILEAPFYKLPVVNVGERQKGRLNAGNVDFVEYDKAEIIQALKKAVFDEKYRGEVKLMTNPYGDGDADKKIVSFLKSIDFDDDSWLIKKKTL